MNKLKIFIALAVAVIFSSPLITTAETVQFNNSIKEAIPEFVGSPTVYRLENGETAVIGGVASDSWPRPLKEVYFLNDKLVVTRTATLPVGVAYASAFELDHILYVLGGNSGNLTQPSSVENGQVFRYDFDTNTFVVDSKNEARIPVGEVHYFLYQGYLMRLVKAIPPGQRYFDAHPVRLEMYQPQLGWYEQKLQVSDPIADLYREVLQREPDSIGLRYWQARHQEGLSIDDIRREFMRSPEYIKKLATN
jgi:hypothetical protein